MSDLLQVTPVARRGQASLLHDFLAARLPQLASLEVDDPAPMFGGWNSAMSSFTARLDGIEKRYVLRGALPLEKQVALNDLEREWAVLNAVAAADADLAPSPVFYDATGAELGAASMIIEFVDAVQLQAAAVSASPESSRELVTGLAHLAARIHAVPIDDAPIFAGEQRDWDSYIDERIDYLRRLESQWIDADPTLRYVAAWLDAHRPPPTALTVVHGDFHTSNAMVRPNGHQLAVDWQFTHVGDPREDLGWTMIYESVAPPPLVTTRQGEFCSAYRTRSGLSEDVINTRAIKWFALLATARVVGATVPAAQRFIAGTNTSVTLASGLALGVIPHRFLLELIEEMETP